MDGFLDSLFSSLCSGAERIDPVQVREMLGGLSAAELLDLRLGLVKGTAFLESVGVLVEASLAAEGSEDDDQVASAVAVHLGRSRGRAKADLELAGQLARCFPDTLVALESGLIERDSARLIAKDLSLLSDAEMQANVETRLLMWLGDHERNGARRTWGQVKAWLQREVNRIDPAATAARHKRARKERDFTCEPSRDNDSTAVLTLRGVPMDRAAQIHSTIQVTAERMHRAGDGRELNELRADLAEALLLGEFNSEQAGQGEARFMFTMPLSDLAGHGDSGTAEIISYGPIVTEVARRMVLNNLDNHNASFAVAVTDEMTGRLLHLHPMNRRFFTGWLRKTIDADHLECAHPACSKPAITCEGDHIVEWAKGGPTTQENGQPLCRQHHHDLGKRGWRRTPIPEARGECVWTSPYGHQYTTKPRPMVAAEPA